MALNVDVALTHNLDGHLSGSFATCALPAFSSNPCPVAGTMTKATAYRDDNVLWLNDFKRVLIVMMDKGLSAI